MRDCSIVISYTHVANVSSILEISEKTLYYELMATEKKAKLNPHLILLIDPNDYVLPVVI